MVVCPNKNKQQKYKKSMKVNYNYIFFYSAIHQGFSTQTFHFIKKTYYIFVFFYVEKSIGLFLNLDFHRPQTSDKSFYDFLINMALIQGFLFWLFIEFVSSIIIVTHLRFFQVNNFLKYLIMSKDFSTRALCGQTGLLSKVLLFVGIRGNFFHC